MRKLTSSDLNYTTRGLFLEGIGEVVESTVRAEPVLGLLRGYFTLSDDSENGASLKFLGKLTNKYLNNVHRIRHLYLLFYCILDLAINREGT